MPAQRRRAPLLMQHLLFSKALLFATAVLLTSLVLPVCGFANPSWSSASLAIWTFEPSSTSSTELFASSNAPQRKPRRSLEKRPRKRDRKGSSSFDDGSAANNGRIMSSSYTRNIAPDNDDAAFWETAERRSLISWAAREAGEDYWYDVDEYRKVQEREAAQRAREPGQISNQKLWVEILSPYKQNWIGLISVSIIALAFIFKNFPEVIDPPVIPNIPAML